MPNTKRKGVGRPSHKSDPAKPFATTLPQSAIERLSELHAQTGRPRSEIIAKALEVYERIYTLLLP
jgi:hypothetical protein